MVNDQWGSPTWTRDLAEALSRIIRTGRYGIYHATGQGECTWMDFAQAIVGLGNMQTPVLPQTTEELNRPAPRPRYAVMRNQTLMLSGLPLLPSWKSSLERYLKEQRLAPTRG
ncbi:dTDP-4-dehydrorhamnose reductase [compost metagenome]